MNLVSWIVVFLLALCAAMTGVFLADEWTGSHRAQTTTDFHELMHDNLNLTSDQEAALKQIEDRFGRRKAEIEAKVRKTNRALAEATSYTVMFLVAIVINVERRPPPST